MIWEAIESIAEMVALFRKNNLLLRFEYPPR
jgi:hypothetical protein